MARRWVVLGTGALALLLGATGAQGQNALTQGLAGETGGRQAASEIQVVAPAMPIGMPVGESLVSLQTANDALYELSQRADVIFAGQVTAVRRHDGRGIATGVVEIEFAVEDAVRGTSGGRYLLREWAGLWPAGDAPFHVGERFLMLLHAAGASGLSSPVGGQDGAVPIRGGTAAGSFEQSAWREVGPGDAPPPLSRTVDLRWMATRTVRPVVYRPEPLHVPWGAAGDGPRATGTAEMQVRPLGAAADPGLQDSPYEVVLTMLRSWEKDTHATH